MMMTTQRKINFNAGPATLPESVLQQYAEAMLEYNNTGMSILELPHRSQEFVAIVNESNELVRKLCHLDDSYEVLWIQGGGRLQFCMVPMNFLGTGETAGFLDTGNWAAEAMDYAQYYGNVNIVETSKHTKYDRLPEITIDLTGFDKYVHITTNNTIFGTQWHTIPRFKAPLFADMSSDIFSMERDYSHFALFYAAVQKNLGTPGLALVVIKKELLEKPVRTLPPMLSYKAHAAQNSILHTANVSAQYCSLLMLRWLSEKGIFAIERENRLKATLLYNVIDNSSIFIPHVKEVEHRSLMNVCFIAATPDIEKAFLAHCHSQNIIGIEGHRSVGGFRVSMYNAVPLSWVSKLANVMMEFEDKYV